MGAPNRRRAIAGDRVPGAAGRADRAFAAASRARSAARMALGSDRFRARGAVDSILNNRTYAKTGLGRQGLPKNPFFSPRRGLRPRRVEKRRVLGGLQALQTSRIGAAC